MAQKEEPRKEELIKRWRSNALAFGCVLLLLIATAAGWENTILAGDQPEPHRLAGITIDCAKIESDKHQAIIEVKGEVYLPLPYSALAPVAVVNVYIGERFVVNEDIRFEREASAWKSLSQKVGVRFEWISETRGRYYVHSEFDPSKYALRMQEEMSDLTYVLALGNRLLTGESHIYEREWHRRGSLYWARCTSVPD